MARGKQTCKILKEIRRQIAEANGIELVTSECRYKGDCLGSCPKCEAEVRFLEQQLRARTLAGRAVSLAGISVSALAMLLPSHAHTQSNNAESCISKQNFEIYESNLNDNELTKPEEDQDGIDDFTKQLIGEVVIIDPTDSTPGLQFCFLDENGQYLDHDYIKIERIKKQAYGVVVKSARVNISNREYNDSIFPWRNLPVFPEENIDEVESITLRVMHPRYEDVKIFEIKKPKEISKITIRFISPKKK